MFSCGWNMKLVTFEAMAHRMSPHDIYLSICNKGLSHHVIHSVFYFTSFDKEGNGTQSNIFVTTEHNNLRYFTFQDRPPIEY